MRASTPGSMGPPAPAGERGRAQRRAWPALLAATLAALLFAAVASPRVDYEGAAAEALDRGEAGSDLTPHEREAALATARRVGVFAAYLDAAIGTALRAVGMAIALWAAFQVAGGHPDFRGSFSVACRGLLPGALRRVASLPALLGRTELSPFELGRLLPAGPGALLEPGARGPLPSLLWSVDLFSLAAVALVAAGMAAVAGVTLRRSLATTAVLWIGEVAVLEVALPALGGLR